jgi:hypothetical protein
MNISEQTQLATQSASPVLSYYGGKILKQPKFVSVYAGDFWNTSHGASQRQFLNGCSKSLTTGAYASLWGEYGASKGSFVGSTTRPLPPNRRVITETDIRSVVAGALKQPTMPRPDGSTVYTVFLPPGAVLQHGDVTSRDGLGGFHGDYKDASTGKTVYYAAVVYAEPGNGINFTSNPVDNVTIAASHEWAETVTDPDVRAGKLAWYNKNYGEVGDIPISLGYPLSQVWGTIDGCAAQKEWSNAKRAPILTR